MTSTNVAAVINALEINSQWVSIDAFSSINQTKENRILMMTRRWLIAAMLTALASTACSSDAPTPDSKQVSTTTGAVTPAPQKKPATNTAASSNKANDAHSKLQGHVVGKVGSRLLTDQDIDAAFAQMPANFQKMKANPAMRANILNNLMTRLALTEKAKQMGIADEPAVRSKIERAQTGILLQALNQHQRTKLAANSDAELKAYYNANIKRFTTPEQVHVRHLLLSSEKEAKKLMKRLKKGADFAKLAKKYSQDKGSKERGGDIGSFPRGRMAPAFEKAAFALQSNGELTGPIHTRFGYHIIERLGHTPAGSKPFEQVKAQIKNELQQQAFRTWVEKVKQEMGLTIIDPRYKRGGQHRRPTHP